MPRGDFDEVSRDKTHFSNRLSDSQGISWDWIIDGREPKESLKKARFPKSASPTFDIAGINGRYLSLFLGLTQTQIAAQFAITTSTVNDWGRNKRRVSWQRLYDATRIYGVRWDWLIDGLEPKLRG